MYYVKVHGDSSTIALLGLGLCKRNKQPNTITLSYVPTNLPNTPIICALLQGKVDLAWTLLRPDWNTNAWSTLIDVTTQKRPANVKHITMLMNPKSWMGSAWTPEWTWCLRAAATILSSSILEQQSEDSQIYDRVLSEYSSHTHLTMRNRRIYEIPHSCLYWFTQRGALLVNETTESELQMNLEDTLVGSKYWSSLLPIGYDLAREEFFYKHFPDDIPDEWSTADRLKSHGIGCVPTGTAVNHNIMFNRCLIRWISNIPCRHIWRGIELAIEEFTQRWEVYRPNTMETGIHEAYEQIDVDSWINEMESWSLVSKKRRFVEV